MLRYDPLANDAADAIYELRAESAALRSALGSISESLRKAGATLPAPEPTGTIEGAMNGGLCIALCVVEEATQRLDAARAALDEVKP